MAGGKIRESFTGEDAHSEWPLEERIYACEEQISRHFDLARPIWLAKNRQHLKNFGSTRFDQDNFIETIGFQYLELEIVGTDDDEGSRP